MDQTISVFKDKDVRPALDRLITEKPFMMMAKSLAPDMTREKLRLLFDNIHTIRDFQHLFIAPVVDMIIEKTTKGLSYEGIENLQPGQAYLFISNHRDIILDSTFLNYILLKNNFETTQLAIGDNLLVKPWITDFLRLNKSFLVRRNMPAREIYQYSHQLSEYIRKTIMDEHTSIWIAQREGRAKDGHDLTQTGVLKMLSLGNDGDFAGYFKSMKIVPVSISYELDPNARTKVYELYVKDTKGKYEKSGKDDLKSMITGIAGPKGHVHINISKPISDELNEFPADETLNNKVRMLADLLDNFIQSNYHLWPANYIASDLLAENDIYSSHYTPEARDKFMGIMQAQIEGLEGETAVLRKIFLKMYANPVANQYRQKMDS